MIVRQVRPYGFHLRSDVYAVNLDSPDSFDHQVLGLDPD